MNNQLCPQYFSTFALAYVKMLIVRNRLSLRQKDELMERCIRKQREMFRPLTVHEVIEIEQNLGARR